MLCMPAFITSSSRCCCKHGLPWGSWGWLPGGRCFGGRLSIPQAQDAAVSRTTLRQLMLATWLTMLWMPAFNTSSSRCCSKQWLPWGSWGWLPGGRCSGCWLSIPQAQETAVSKNQVQLPLAKTCAVKEISLFYLSFCNRKSASVTLDSAI